MKFVILTGLLFLLVAIFAARYRRQINSAVKFWKYIQNEDFAERQKERKSESPGVLREVALVKCLNCGAWISPEDAVRIKTRSVYCSENCFAEMSAGGMR